MVDKIRVLVADDHAIVREGIRAILAAQQDIEVVGEASTGRETVDKALSIVPDIVVMDIAMPDLDGLEATRLIRQANPSIKVLALTMHDSESYFFEAMRAGAAGYVLKEAAGADLLSALRAIHRGGIFLHPQVAEKLVSDYLTRVDAGEERTRYDGLTERERQILKLIAQGKTSQEIADILFLSVNTVQTHRMHIMDKLNLHNRAELIRYAIRKGLIVE